MSPRPQHRHGILLKIAYDGSPFSGLAVQSNATTIGGLIEQAVATMDPNATRLRVASRTDAGVHARGQYVAFDTDMDISTRGWMLGLTGVLPPEIAIQQAARIEAGFEPSRRALEKTYSYSILQGTVRDPFLHNRSWRVFERLNHELMRREAEDLVGSHDFRAFRGAADLRTDTVRRILSVIVQQSSARVLRIEVRGNRFLYNMVRIIVGTLVDVGRDKLGPGAVKRALQSGNRLDLGMTAPAEGLCLEHIELDQQGFDKWPDHL